MGHAEKLVMVSFSAFLLALVVTAPVSFPAVWVLIFLTGVCMLRRKSKLDDTDILPTVARGDASGEMLFFIHGWPDKGSLFEAQVAHFAAKGYRCITITLPLFDCPQKTNADWGYDFVEVTKLLGRTLAAELKKQGPSQATGRRATLVVHDWGAALGFYLERAYPHLVSRIVAMDIGPLSGRRMSLATAPAILIMGLTYQYWLATAFVVRNAVPCGYGCALADLIVYTIVKVIGAPHHTSKTSVELGREGLTSANTGFYFWFHVTYWLQVLHLRPSFDSHFASCNGNLKAKQRPPTLFFYASDKPFMFHKRKWEKALEADPRCSVVALKGVGHWLMKGKGTAVVNAEMDKFFGKLE